jgi:hypothetical protein
LVVKRAWADFFSLSRKFVTFIKKLPHIVRLKSSVMGVKTNLMMKKKKFSRKAVIEMFAKRGSWSIAEVRQRAKKLAWPEDIRRILLARHRYRLSGRMKNYKHLNFINDHE